MAANTMMSISVKVLKGKEAQIEVTESAAISSFKTLIAEEFNIPAECQRLVFKGKTLADSGKLCDYNIKDGTKVHLFINDKIPPRYATATAASTTSGMAMTSAAGGAQFRPKSIACGSVPLTASSTPLSRKSPSSADTPMDTDQLEIFKQTKLWTALDHTLQPHFRPEDLERVKYQFFTNFHRSISKLSLPELEEYAKTSLGS